MDCEKCKHKFEPVWTPPVARFTPKTPLPDGAVCIRLDTSADIYWTRTGTYIYVYRDWQNYGFTAQAYAEATRALGLPVWGVDINRDGETKEEFWTDAECWTRGITKALGWVAGKQLYLPSFHDLPGLQPRLVTTLRRYHGTRRDGVSVDGWIVKPVAVEQPKPAPGQPCPACGQPVPEPAPFKAGDILKRKDADELSVVYATYRSCGEWCFESTRGMRSACHRWEVFRPALPPLPEDVLIWAEWALQKASASPTMYVDGIAVARFLRSLYPNELKD